MQEMIRKSTFAFANSEELLEFPRLFSHKVVFIGGIAVDTPKPLNKVYKIHFGKNDLCKDTAARRIRI
ncbi:unnamed protein product [Gongylonema pulchrum]|uniref:DHFR domain-containing protein n=1 Tax=Gongylonema pulchrum TaxID=637853 RepID=A0A183CZL8_9BILA|nr:unnamed protein product [Gongylonema pulchrum]